MLTLAGEGSTAGDDFPRPGLARQRSGFGSANRACLGCPHKLEMGRSVLDYEKFFVTIVGPLKKWPVTVRSLVFRGRRLTDKQLADVLVFLVGNHVSVTAVFRWYALKYKQQSKRIAVVWNRIKFKRVKFRHVRLSRFEYFDYVARRRGVSDDQGLEGADDDDDDYYDEHYGHNIIMDDDPDDVPRGPADGYYVSDSSASSRPLRRRARSPVVGLGPGPPRPLTPIRQGVATPSPQKRRRIAPNARPESSSEHSSSTSKSSTSGGLNRRQVPVGNVVSPAVPVRRGNNRPRRFISEAEKNRREIDRQARADAYKVVKWNKLMVEVKRLVFARRLRQRDKHMPKWTESADSQMRRMLGKLLKDKPDRSSKTLAWIAKARADLKKRYMDAHPRLPIYQSSQSESSDFVPPVVKPRMSRARRAAEEESLRRKDRDAVYSSDDSGDEAAAYAGPPSPSRTPPDSPRTLLVRELQDANQTRRPLTLDQRMLIDDYGINASDYYDSSGSSIPPATSPRIAPKLPRLWKRKLQQPASGPPPPFYDPYRNLPTYSPGGTRKASYSPGGTFTAAVPPYRSSSSSSSKGKKNPSKTPVAVPARRSSSSSSSKGKKNPPRTPVAVPARRSSSSSSGRSPMRKHLEAEALKPKQPKVLKGAFMSLDFDPTKKKHHDSSVLDFLPTDAARTERVRQSNVRLRRTKDKKIKLKQKNIDFSSYASEPIARKRTPQSASARLALSIPAPVAYPRTPVARTPVPHTPAPGWPPFVFPPFGYGGPVPLARHHTLVGDLEQRINTRELLRRIGSLEREINIHNPRDAFSRANLRRVPWGGITVRNPIRKVRVSTKDGEKTRFVETGVPKVYGTMVPRSWNVVPKKPRDAFNMSDLLTLPAEIHVRQPVTWRLRDEPHPMTGKPTRRIYKTMRLDGPPRRYARYREPRQFSAYTTKPMYPDVHVFDAPDPRYPGSVLPEYTPDSSRMGTIFGDVNVPLVDVALAPFDFAGLSAIDRDRTNALNTRSANARVRGDEVLGRVRRNLGLSDVRSRLNTEADFSRTPVARRLRPRGVGTMSNRSLAVVPFYNMPATSRWRREELSPLTVSPDAFTRMGDSPDDAIVDLTNVVDSPADPVIDISD